MKPLSWWKEHEVRFPKLSILAQQILRILGLQIKIDFFFQLGNSSQASDIVFVGC
jgi:hypothetical protein